MNIPNCAAKLLTCFSPEERSIPDSLTYPGRNSAVQEAMNSALQDIFGKGKPFLRHDERGAVLFAPETVPIAVTKGSKTATIALANWESWYSGCTCIIAGADADNQIRGFTTVASTVTITLKYPYAGETGTHDAVVYHDSIDMDSDIMEVLDPVRLDRHPMILKGKLLDHDTPRRTEDFGFTQRSGRDEFKSIATTLGTPRNYIIESWSGGATEPFKTRMRVFPAPTKTHFVEFKAMLLPPRIESLTASMTLPMPFGFIESIFLPIAMKKLRSCPFWRGIVGDDEIENGYRNALSLLSDATTAKTTGFSITSRF